MGVTPYILTLSSYFKIDSWSKSIIGGYRITNRQKETNGFLFPYFDWV